MPNTPKILIAEDERMMQKAISFKIEKAGYAVDIAIDGQQAKEKLEANTYDLVVLDLMMPYVSGMELIEFVKKKSSSCPVIVLSSLGQESTIIKAFELGADDFMTKPFSPVELLVRIKKLLK